MGSLSKRCAQRDGTYKTLCKYQCIALRGKTYVHETSSPVRSVHAPASLVCQDITLASDGMLVPGPVCVEVLSGAVARGFLDPGSQLDLKPLNLPSQVAGDMASGTTMVRFTTGWLTSILRAILSLGS